MQDEALQSQDTEVLCTKWDDTAFCGSLNCVSVEGDVEAIGSCACQEPKREREG